MTPPSKKPRRVFIETWGCQMNELDSQRMAGQLMQQGILPTREPEEADIILLNSCSVREKAEQKVYSRLGEYRLLKRTRRGPPDRPLRLRGPAGRGAGSRAGCPTSTSSSDPRGSGSCRRSSRGAGRASGSWPPAFRRTGTYDIDAISRQGEYKGMVTIIEGCDKNCTFCIVPQTRGPERSRPLAEVLREVRHLLDYGFQEIELLGQTVNHWREPGGDLDFADLLEAVATAAGSPAPALRHLLPARLHAAHGGAGGDATPTSAPTSTCRCSRGPTACCGAWGAATRAPSTSTSSAQLRRARPGLALSTDIIVGFPGETEEDFQQTLDLVREVRFRRRLRLQVLAAAGDRGAAARRRRSIPAVASERLQRLFAVQEGIQREINEEPGGGGLRRRGDRLGASSRGLQTGRTPCHRIVHFQAGPEPAPLGSVTRSRCSGSQLTACSAHQPHPLRTRSSPRSP